MEILVPILGILAGIIIPLSVFIWLYLESKDKNRTILAISKNLDDPSKIQDLVNILEERKKQPIDYRRTGVITLFTGAGLFLLGLFYLGSILKGVGALVAASPALVPPLAASLAAHDLPPLAGPAAPVAPVDALVAAPAAVAGREGGGRRSGQRWLGRLPLGLLP